MNSRGLKDKLKNISNEKNIDFNTLLRLYMYDRFIERLSVSKYRDNFILKGGFYLSTLFGINNRSTMDIDALFKMADFNEENIVKIIKEILNIKLNDNTQLNYLKTESIRDEDEYGGFRVFIEVKIENIKERFNLDIVTGDPITPKEIVYKYKPILGDKSIKLLAYNLETVLAEKLETVLTRVEANGRMRDFYDIYLIYTKDWSNIKTNNLKKAIDNTFSKREYSGNSLKALEIIKESNELRNRWKRYQKKNDYAKNIDFEDIIKCLEKIINIIILEYV